MSVATLAIRAALAAAVLLAAVSAEAAGPATAAVWNASPIVGGSVSAAMPVAGSDPVFTVYLKQVASSPVEYWVYLQASPDGANWSTVKSGSVFVPANQEAGLVYSFTVDVKATQVRLVAYPGRLAYTATVSAWIAH